MRYSCISRLLLLAFCVTAHAIAQSTSASISGQVVDPTGRVIPDADIQILNEATGVQYANKTNSSGIYTVSILPPGQYRVQVSKIGFKTLIKPGIVLNVESAVALNFTLPVGAPKATRAAWRRLSGELSRSGDAAEQSMGQGIGGTTWECKGRLKRQ